MIERYLHHFIARDLKEKMVFIAGPRQVGKTTLARLIGEKKYPERMYFNWDNQIHRKSLLRAQFNPHAKLLIFDELHKYKAWKSYIKGIFDTYRENFHILVTGSARLDLYRKGGDSLMGRYHSYRLHPFSIAELIDFISSVRPYQDLLSKQKQKHKNTHNAFESLLRFGGFPEPFLKQEEKTWRRWHNERCDRLIKEDIRDIEVVRDISLLQILIDLLPEKVGSLFSINSLCQDLQTTYKTVKHWIEVFEKFYYHFRIYPFSSRRIYALRKEPKLYLWDWSLVKEDSARIENMVAAHLLKYIHFLYDTEGFRVELNYLRDTVGREVDFLVTANKKPWFAVEVKVHDIEPSKNLQYFMKKLSIPFCYQVVGQPDIDVIQNNIRIVSADNFLSALV